MHGIGPGLAADVLNTLLARGLLVFDVGIVGPGALAAVFYLRGGEGTQPRCYSLWPRQDHDYKVRDAIAHLAALNYSQTWNVNHALRSWRSTDSLLATSPR
jgi:hypothetical protein